MSSEFHIDYAPITHLYAKEQLTGTLYLAFRDIPQILNDYLNFDKKRALRALDFGCGTGVSTRYLQSLENLFFRKLKVCGVDINLDMLKKARQDDSIATYYQIDDYRIPIKNEYFDLAISTFVLHEFASLKEMEIALNEVKRVMNKGAIFIAVTGSTETYRRNNRWVSLNVDFSQNDYLKSGDLGRVDYVLEERTLSFENYYWSESDYEHVFEQVGLELLETKYPLGTPEEQKKLMWKWKSELTISPYYTFVLRK